MPQDEQGKLDVQDEQSKLDVFVRTIMEESSEDVSGILLELERRRAAAAEAAEVSITAEAARYKTSRISEIRSREGRRINARQTESKQKFLLLRERCAETVFAEVREKLADFTGTPEYLDYLKSKLLLAFTKLGYGFAAKLFLRAEDMPLAPELLKLSRGITLTVSPGHVRYGGFHLVCPSRGIRIDMSFDTALGDLVGHFAELSGMTVAN